MTSHQPPAAILLRVPFATGTGAEIALVLDELPDLIIGRPLDCDEVRVYDVRHFTEFFFPSSNLARRILTGETFLLGGAPGLLGREGHAECQRQLPRLHRLAADGNGEPPLPDAIAQRCGLAPQTPLPDLPDFGSDEPPRRSPRRPQ